MGGGGASPIQHDVICQVIRKLNDWQLGEYYVMLSQMIFRYLRAEKISYITNFHP